MPECYRCGTSSCSFVLLQAPQSSSSHLLGFPRSSRVEPSFADETHFQRPPGSIRCPGFSGAARTSRHALSRPDTYDQHPAESTLPSSPVRFLAPRDRPGSLPPEFLPEFLPARRLASPPSILACIRESKCVRAARPTAPVKDSAGRKHKGEVGEDMNSQRKATEASTVTNPAVRLKTIPVSTGGNMAPNAIPTLTYTTLCRSFPKAADMEVLVIAMLIV
ncbi:uncharacterized protein LOC118564013 [Fundulus heteroclitus]|uniref:uncharacterized protein LOC118564013 n=1 Tax=Fundulus heteroclitus TaxID=8078 RepID=UPI00165AAC55|nr:uncharacterized protein LOC118564013 [Fundulus heteroclitus]